MCAARELTSKKKRRNLKKGPQLHVHGGAARELTSQKGPHSRGFFKGCCSIPGPPGHRAGADLAFFQGGV